MGQRMDNGHILTFFLFFVLQLLWLQRPLSHGGLSPPGPDDLRSSPLPCLPPFIQDRGLDH